jgi:TolB protein
MRRMRSVLASIGLAAALAGLVLAPVSASYPGKHNGRIAFGVRAADGSANIFSVKPDGAGRTQLTHGPGNHLCAAYSADGRSIAYCSDVSGSFEIWTMHQDGSNQRQLTHLGGFATFPDFSPTGRKVIFGGTEGADEHTEIYVVDAHDGSGLQALTSCAGFGPGCFNDTPAWSPDGTKIVFIHGDDYDQVEDHPVNQQVWVMNADGTNPHAVTSGSDPKDQVPDWSPNGSKIAFNAQSSSGGQIWVMDANGANPQQLTGCASGADWPCATGDDFGTAWSPDGTKISFVRDLRAIGGSDRPVMVMDADGSHVHRLSATLNLAAVPAWQPVAPPKGH